MYYTKMFNPDTINIFCDGSITELGKETIGCAGSIVVLTESQQVSIIKERYEIIRNCTNNICELTGILLSLYNIVELNLNNNFKVINIFSDSLLCVNTFNEWIYKWVYQQVNDVLYNTSGEVKNQNLIKYIINFVINNNIRFNLYHTRGHINSDNTKMFNKARDTFIKTNKTYTVMNVDLVSILQFNNVVDNKSRTILLNEVANIHNKQSKQKEVFKHIIDSKGINQYRNLINKTRIK